MDRCYAEPLIFLESCNSRDLMGTTWWPWWLLGKQCLRPVIINLMQRGSRVYRILLPTLPVPENPIRHSNSTSSSSSSSSVPQKGRGKRKSSGAFSVDALVALIARTHKRSQPKLVCHIAAHRVVACHCCANTCGAKQMKSAISFEFISWHVTATNVRW